MSALRPIHPTQEQIESAVQEIRSYMVEAGPLYFAREAKMSERVVLALADQESSLRTQLSRLTELRDSLVESLESMGGIPMTDRLAAALDESRTVIIWPEGRRSDAGRVEVPELTYEAFAEIMDSTELIASVRQRETVRRERIAAWFRSRLSPSPQPATGAAQSLDDETVMYHAMSRWIERTPSCPSPMEGYIAGWQDRPFSPQPSADVVVVPREEWEAYQKWEKTVRGLAFGMSRENECLATLDAIRSAPSVTDDRFASCPRREPCTPVGCAAGGGTWPRCPSAAEIEAHKGGDHA